LNAIAKARQLALLIMEMYEQEGVVFSEINEFEHEQEYYGQVADGDKWRIQRGQGQKILTMLGLRDVSQLRQHRALLRMEQNIWDFADDNDISEYELREMIRMGLTPISRNSGGISATKSASSKEPEPNLFFQEWHKLAQRQRDLAKKLASPDRHKMVIMLRQLADEIEKMK
jgi:hypothetical protein